jgi:hypothetical protein
MATASAFGTYKVKDVVDSMRQLYGERTDVPTSGSSFATMEKTILKLLQEKEPLGGRLLEETQRSLKR